MTGERRVRRIYSGAVAVFFLLTASWLFGQPTNFSLRILRTSSNAVVAWNGQGALQSSVTLPPAWTDVLEATNPTVVSSNSAGFFRVVSHWGTRSNLIEANSEMAVAELNGWIHMPGGGTSTGGSSGSLIHQVFWVGGLADFN